MLVQFSRFTKPLITATTQMIACSNQQLLFRRQRWCCPSQTGIRSEVLAGPNIFCQGELGPVNCRALHYGHGMALPGLPHTISCSTNLSASQGLVCKTLCLSRAAVCDSSDEFIPLDDTKYGQVCADVALPFTVRIRFQATA